MVPSSVINYCCAILQLITGWYLLKVNSFSIKVTPPAIIIRKQDRQTTAEDDHVQAIIGQAETICRARHDNRVVLSLFVPVPDRPIPRPCTATDDPEAEATSPTHLYGSKCLPIPPTDFPAGSYLRLGPGGYTKDESFLDGDGLVQCTFFSKRERNFGTMLCTAN
jgi:hypothetical protein